MNAVHKLQGCYVLHSIEGDPALNNVQVSVDEFRKHVKLFQALDLVFAGPGQIDILRWTPKTGQVVKLQSGS